MKEQDLRNTLKIKKFIDECDIINFVMKRNNVSWNDAHRIAYKSLFGDNDYYEEIFLIKRDLMEKDKNEILIEILDKLKLDEIWFVYTK